MGIRTIIAGDSRRKKFRWSVRPQTLVYNHLSKSLENPQVFCCFCVSGYGDQVCF